MENRPKEGPTCSSILRFVWQACDEEEKWIWSLEGVEGLAARSGGYSLLARLLTCCHYLFALFSILLLVQTCAHVVPMIVIS
jgi:hypothetical protein